jgi:hypothetical protein
LLSTGKLSFVKFHSKSHFTRRNVDFESLLHRKNPESLGKLATSMQQVELLSENMAYIEMELTNKKAFCDTKLFSRESTVLRFRLRQVAII